jgi:hypothetical protein
MLTVILMMMIIIIIIITTVVVGLLGSWLVIVTDGVGMGCLLMRISRARINVRV